MGFLSKKKDDTEDSNRSALFGSRKKDKESAAGHNPYAAPSAKDPYAQPPPAYSGGHDSYRQEKSPAVTGPGQGYGQHGRGYGNQGGGSGGQSGYGNDRYSGGQQARGPGGYGGLGRADSNDTMSTDAGRNELFGNAAQRQQAPQQQQSGRYGQSGAYGDNNQSGAYGASSGGYGQAPGGYGAYGDRELTAEEQEEEDVNATKNEIKFMKQQDVSSTRNALRLAQQAEETGRDTLARLGAQGERIHKYVRPHCPIAYCYVMDTDVTTARSGTWILPARKTESPRRRHAS